ncbi:MAG TPA: cardiolipin synthase [Lacipirellulaceae bacterium]
MDWIPDSRHDVYVIVHFLIQVGIALRVVMQRRPIGESLAWIMVVFAIPVGGPILYLLIGELRLGRKRGRRYAELTKPVKEWLSAMPGRSPFEWPRLAEEFQPVSQLFERTIGLPSIPCNQAELLSPWSRVLECLLADIDAAKSSCHLEFYIWSVGGEADKVAEALIRARERGVECRVVVDAVGSRRFLRSEVAKRLRSAGVLLCAALPGGIIRMLFVRFDLRMHRKIVVIDGRIGYTGSLNMVDPRYFKRGEGYGQWVDAMVRLEGPAVEAMQITFLGDWYEETDATLEDVQHEADAVPQPQRGDCPVQVMPSGPDLPPGSVELVLLTAVYSARRELVITTPYFMPNESLAQALVAAVRRGVKVIVVIPKKVDSMLVRYASGTVKGQLLEAGVRIAQFGGGLLHTKSVTVDGAYSLFGSVNLDPRSLRLNFEILLALYDAEFTGRLRALQQEYIDKSTLMNVEAYRRRPRWQQSAESFARLLAPLL